MCKQKTLFFKPLIDVLQKQSLFISMAILIKY